MSLTDIHIDALFGVDDEAKTEEEMNAIIDASYSDGVRTLCLTPHFHPGYFGDNNAKAFTAFQLLSEHVKKECPEMSIYLGNELRYSRGCLSWLADGSCRTLNKTRFVLVDFQEAEDRLALLGGTGKLLSAGYVPILAHAERYRNLNFRDLYSLRADGVLIQMDAQSIFRSFGFGAQHRCKRMLAEHLIDIVASDAHNLKNRPPLLSICYSYIAKRHGVKYADAICAENALHILTDNAVGKGLG